MKKFKTRKLKIPAILLPLTLSPAFFGEFFQMMYMYAPFNKTYVMHVFLSSNQDYSDYIFCVF